MNSKTPGALSITVKFAPEIGSQIVTRAANEGVALATWLRGVAEQAIGVTSEADLTPIVRPEPMTEDELVRRHGVRRLGEIVEILQARDGVPEDIVADLRATTGALVATLPKR